MGRLVSREDVRVSGRRKRYSPKSREQAARLMIETGRPIAHVAAEIGVGGTGAMLDADGRAELVPLRRKNAELRLDRQFLKRPRQGPRRRFGAVLSSMPRWRHARPWRPPCATVPAVIEIPRFAHRNQKVDADRSMPKARVLR